MAQDFNQTALLLTARGPLRVQLAVAHTPWRRLQGLMLHAPLVAASWGVQGLLITRCSSVHGCLVATALDLVYLDADSQVTQTAMVKPWGWHIATRTAGGRPRQVLELPQGTVRRYGVCAGDWLLAASVPVKPPHQGPTPSAWAPAVQRGRA